MKFGRVPSAMAEGALLAHSVKAGGLSLRKGRRITAADVEAMIAAGVAEVTAVRLSQDDLHEDEAAARVAAAVAGPGLRVAEPFTGRVNLFATSAGIVVLDRDRIDGLNAIDESVTLATLPPNLPVEPGSMVATVKIIPFGAPRAAVEAAEGAASGQPIISVAPFRHLKAVLVQSTLPGLKASVLDKTVEVTRARLHGLGGELIDEWRCPHDEAAIAIAVRAALERRPDIVLIAGASAITDRGDVLPAGIVAAGGFVEHLGMPVDPGNLLVLGRVDSTPVIGLPGCARSPKPNGFDWVLQRIVAGRPVTPQDVVAMGVGGLLTEIPSRPMPRESRASAPRAPRIAAIVLAAGRSSRMGSNKLLIPVGGVPMARRAVLACLGSCAMPVVVVTGHEAEKVEATIADLPLTIVRNANFAVGLSTSLRAALEALPDDIDGVVVCLADMPRVSSRLIDRLIAAYAPVEGRAIIVPTHAGKRGNPVLWDRRFFPAMQVVSGDVGAKHLIGENADLVAEVVADDAALLDVDTPDALAAAEAEGTA